MSIPVAVSLPLAEREFISMHDLFRVGIGPSSSHTVGPLRAAKAFVSALSDAEISRVSAVQCTLFGSLGSTGVGRGRGGASAPGPQPTRDSDHRTPPTQQREHA